MRVAYFTHSLQSCWNHGNAHFLRGVLRELVIAGHDVTAYEAAGAWSVQSLLADAGADGLSAWQEYYPELRATAYADPAAAIEQASDADLVIVHEWNEPALAQALGDTRKHGGRFTLLFHDTHHRAVSDPDAMRRFDLSGYDGVLAFGQALTEIYRGSGWGGRAYTWHEAADIRLFHPPATETVRTGAVWIGNWGDGERTAELEQFLLAPTQATDTALDIYGVRYPDDARAMLARHGAQYRGWLPNPRVPAVFARHAITIHVPRRCYMQALPGIPTIRVFEALACGIPLLSAPWPDDEGLFRPGDFLVATDGDAVVQHIEALRDPALRDATVARGLATIRARHTCVHRVQELLAIVEGLR